MTTGPRPCSGDPSAQDGIEEGIGLLRREIVDDLLAVGRVDRGALEQLFDGKLEVLVVLGRWVRGPQCRRSPASGRPEEGRWLPLKMRRSTMAPAAVIPSIEVGSFAP